MITPAPPSLRSVAPSETPSIRKRAIPAPVSAHTSQLHVVVCVASLGHTERSRPVPSRRKRRGGVFFWFRSGRRPRSPTGERLLARACALLLLDEQPRKGRKRTDPGTSGKKDPKSRGRPCAHSAKRQEGAEDSRARFSFFSPPIRTFVLVSFRQQRARLSCARSLGLVWSGSLSSPTQPFKLSCINKSASAKDFAFSPTDSR